MAACVRRVFVICSLTHDKERSHTQMHVLTRTHGSTSFTAPVAIQNALRHYTQLLAARCCPKAVIIKLAAMGDAVA